MKNKHASKKAIIADLQRVFKLFGSPFNAAEYNSRGKFASDTVTRKIGSWESAIKLAGLQKAFDECKKVQTEIKNFDPAKENMKKFEAEKQKMLEREKEKEHKELKKRKMATDIVIENLREAIMKLPPSIIEVHQYPEPKKVVDQGHCTLWFDVSDLQLGTLVIKDKTGGLNEHNWKIWKVKLRRWVDGVKEIIERTRRERTIDSIVIAQLGDMVEGHDIFAGQAYHLEFDVFQQAVYGSEDLAKAYVELASTYPQYTFHLKEVAGNHGRVGKHNETPFHVNFDCVMYEFIRLRLAKHTDVKNIRTEANLAWFLLLQVYGWKHLVIHGDRGIGGKLSIIGLEKMDAKFQKMLQQPIHYTHLGHFHADVSVSDSAGMKVVNGNWIGGSSYSADIVESNCPLQKAYMITPTSGIEVCYYIHLKDRTSSKPEIEIYKVTP